MFYPINIKSLKKKCVLITGSHRSGSTWIGKIMALSRDLQYIHEPFNVAKHKKTPFSNWFQYYDAKSSDFEEQEQVLRYLKAFHKPSLRRLFNRIRRAKYPGQVRDALVKEWACIAKQPLYKDPIAFMSAEWFYENMDAYIVISVRHPAAFVASLKVKNWHFDFNNFLNQERLMEHHLSAYKTELQAQLGQHDIIRTGILLWNIIYTRVFELQKKYNNHPKWIFVKHEDLSTHPVEGFKKIFSKLHLKFSSKIETEINKTTTAKTAGNFTRNSKLNISTWKQRLSAEEIALIKSQTRPVWKNFYTEDEW